MTEELTWFRKNETLLIVGILSRNMINSLWNVRNEVIVGINHIDLQGVTYIDTAGIALLIHVIAIKKMQGINIILTGVVDNMHVLVQLYNLPIDLLPY